MKFLRIFYEVNNENLMIHQIILCLKLLASLLYKIDSIKTWNNFRDYLVLKEHKYYK